MTALREQILKAHGGPERWQRVSEVLARVSVGGWEFASRLYPVPIRDLEVSVSTLRPAVALADFPEAGQSGHYTPERVWIEAADGTIQDERSTPATALRSMRHWFLWDHLDALYYLGLTLWHSLNLPFVLAREEVQCAALPTKVVGGRRLHRLRYCCHGDGLADGEGLLYAEPSGLVCRVDAAPPLPGAWYRLAQSWQRHESVSGLVFPLERRFHPCLINGQAWPLATLAWLRVDDIGLVPKRTRSGAGGSRAAP